MAKYKESARERNARIRREQQRLSEERSRRSLRSEDFQMGSGHQDSVQLHRVEEAARRQSGRERRMSAPQKNTRSEREARVNRERVRSRKAAESTRTVNERGRRPSVRQSIRKNVQKSAQDHSEARKEKKALMQSPALQLVTRHESDFTLVACMVLLSFIGVVMVTSSSYYHAYNTFGDSLYFFRKQIGFLLFGTVVLIFGMYFSMKWIKKLAWVVYLVAVACTILVLFIGKEVNGSTRWIAVAGIQFQPAEIAKLGVALFLAVKVEQYQKSIKTLKTFLILFMILAVPVGFVLIQNLSSALIIAVIGIVIMFVGGCRFRYFVFIGLVVAGAFVIFVVLPAMVPLEAFPGFLHGFLEKFMYRSNRIEAFLDPFKYSQTTGYQTVQSLYAVGSGGLFGVGLGESIQKLGFIPEAYNDIIFAIICEELGLFGATIVILLFGTMVKQGIQIASDAPDRFTTYVAAGLITQIGIQAIMNIAVNTNTIPATGVSLPFISYGGSSFIFLMASMGILLNISRYTRDTGTLRTGTE